MFKLLVLFALLAFAFAAPKAAPQYFYSGLYGGYTGLGYGYGYSALPYAYGGYGYY
ncbi:keratin-associated protein 19-9b-like [Tribolium madens]|uniref:keratin-associated protein 19-9b-like n=1 Tax=Tribolium madens TaxID=41895 RepID=UPI001CF75AA1|nr:keratin-associated protein 19-9b-like [Tribolium madens]